MRKRANSVGAAAIAAGAVLAGAAACAPPDFTYVKNSGAGTYFKVPHEWRQIGTESVDDALSGTTPDSAASGVRQQLWWSVAYDAADDPSPAHLLTDAVTDEPVVYARVAELTETERDGVSLNTLRDSFLPVTETARAAAAAATTAGLSGFELLGDEVLTPDNGLHGVRVIYDYELGGVPHTFDQTALVNNDGSKLYLLVIRCSTRCYRERSGELGTVATSFTVRSS